MAAPPLTPRELQGSDAASVAAAVHSIVEFFSVYKKRNVRDAAEPSTTAFLWNATVLDGPSAARVVLESHRLWCALLGDQTRSSGWGRAETPPRTFVGLTEARVRVLLKRHCAPP